MGEEREREVLLLVGSRGGRCWEADEGESLWLTLAGVAGDGRRRSAC